MTQPLSPALADAFERLAQCVERARIAGGGSMDAATFAGELSHQMQREARALRSTLAGTDDDEKEVGAAHEFQNDGDGFCSVCGTFHKDHSALQDGAPAVPPGEPKPTWFHMAATTLRNYVGVDAKDPECRAFFSTLADEMVRRAEARHAPSAPPQNSAEGGGWVLLETPAGELVKAERGRDTAVASAVRAGIEAAAKWHEAQAGAWDAKADKLDPDGGGYAAACINARAHTRSAKDLRSLDPVAILKAMQEGGK